MYIIKKKFMFSAAHSLDGLPANHPCSRLHGHNYEVTVELHSFNLNAVGFVEDYRALDDIKAFIDDALDHKNLNDFLPFNPTAENIAQHLYEIFKKKHPFLSAVEVSETPKTSARYEPS